MNKLKKRDDIIEENNEIMVMIIRSLEFIVGFKLVLIKERMLLESISYYF